MLLQSLQFKLVEIGVIGRRNSSGIFLFLSLFFLGRRRVQDPPDVRHLRLSPPVGAALRRAGLQAAAQREDTLEDVGQKMHKNISCF